jgi:hypothetical protein
MGKLKAIVSWGQCPCEEHGMIYNQEVQNIHAAQFCLCTMHVKFSFAEHRTCSLALVAQKWLACIVLAWQATWLWPVNVSLTLNFECSPEPTVKDISDQCRPLRLLFIGRVSK